MATDRSVDFCIEEGVYDDEVNEDWGCDEESASDWDFAFEHCTATVSDYEACLRAEIDARAAEASRSSCTTVGTDTDDEGDDDERVPEACRELLAKCPNLDE